MTASGDPVPGSATTLVYPTLSDLQGLVDRYEPSGRQWAMRFLAQVKDMAVSELYLTELRIDSTTETWAVAT